MGKIPKEGWHQMSESLDLFPLPSDWWRRSSLRKLKGVRTFTAKKPESSQGDMRLPEAGQQGFSAKGQDELPEPPS